MWLIFFHKRTRRRRQLPAVKLPVAEQGVQVFAGRIRFLGADVGNQVRQGRDAEDWGA